jgi:hypothetical protein
MTQQTMANLIYIEEKSLFMKFITRFSDKQLADDLYQEFYIHFNTLDLNSKLSIDSGKGRIINFLKACFRNFVKAFYRDRINGVNHTGSKSWVNLETINLEETKIEYYQFEAFEQDHDTKALIAKLKEKFPEAEGLYRVIDRTQAGEPLFEGKRRELNSATLERFQKKYPERIREFRKEYL